jgi:F-type H+-transporting ATPase subunit a
MPFAIIGIFAIRVVGAFISSYGMNLIGRNVIRELRREMFSRLISLPKSFYDQATSGQLRAIIGPTGDKYITLIGGLFIFIFFCNIIAIVPGFVPATDNLNTNLAMSLMVFVVYNYYGFKEHGISYLKQFAGPILWLAPLMFLIELLSHLFRPMSLSIRLFGNMFGDHMVLGIFSDLVPLVIPVIFMILGIVVSTIQAFVFAVLTTVYIALAVSHDH